MWKEMVGTDATNKTPLHITNVALCFTGVEAIESGQKRIEGFFKAGNAESDPTTRQRSEKPPSARALQVPLQAPSPPPPEDQTLPVLVEPEPEPEPPSFKCDRCGKKIVLKKGDARTLDALKLEHDDYHFAQDLARSAGGTFTDKDLSASPSKLKRARSRSATPGKPSKMRKDSSSSHANGKKPPSSSAQGIARFLVRKV